ncbi:MAG TPA: hypothetical protein VFS07_04485 [Gemmatimonadales bacterium]|nr:hypothetical protein [Gemmatimonadales bacterium]
MRDHRSLQAWQKANHVVRWVLGMSQQHWRPPVRVPFLHLQTVTLQVQLHIARGNALRSPRHFRRHLVLAYAATIESLELLALLEATHLVPSGEAADAVRSLDQVKGELLNMIRQYRHYR